MSITNLLLLIVASRLLGELMVRVGQSALVGEILAGMILGPALLNVVQPSHELKGIADLSCFLIVMSAGLEMEFREVISAVRGRSFVPALLDFLIPLGAGVSLGFFFPLDTMQLLFLGLCISITALPVAVRILDTFGLLKSSIARYSIATAILNDVLALMFVGVCLDKSAHGLGTDSLIAVSISIAKTAAKFLVFMLFIYVVSRFLKWGGSQTHLIERWVNRIIDFFGREALFGVAVLFVLIFGSMSEGLGSHFVIGAFFGALLLSKDIFGTTLFSELEHVLHSITGGFLAPIFFAYLGLSFSTTSFDPPWFALSVLGVSMASKLLAGYLGSRWLKISHVEALGIGIILNGRGIMELVVANIAFQAGLITQELFSVLVMMGVVTTIATPILFRRFVLPKLTPEMIGS